MLGLLATVLGASVKLVRVRASAYNRTAALLDRETGPDLTWQWTIITGGRSQRTGFVEAD